MLVRPLVLSVFANETQLSYLEAEDHSMQKCFKKLSYLDYRPLKNADRDTFVNSLGDTRESLNILHFGGHAKESTLFFEDGDGHGPGLARLLALHPQLKLVFINACDTQHIARLFEKVPAVLATISPVNDRNAAVFAEEFYKNLSNGATLQEAFEATIAVPAFKDGKSFYHDSIVIRGLDKKKESIEEVPWRLYVDKDMLNWKLTDLEPIFEESGVVIRRETINNTIKQIEALVMENDHYNAIIILQEPQWLKFYPELYEPLAWIQHFLKSHQDQKSIRFPSSLADDGPRKNIRNRFQQVINILKEPLTKK